MNAFTDVAQYFIVNKKNPWRDTPLEEYYALTPKVKGTKGEQIVEALLHQKGYTITAALNAGHDRVINGKKTEIKFGLATDRNLEFKTMYNHIGLNKDWEQIYFVVVNGDGEIRDALFERENLPAILLKKQQGGKNGGNDDFMISGKNSADLIDDANAIHII